MIYFLQTWECVGTWQYLKLPRILVVFRLLGLGELSMTHSPSFDMITGQCVCGVNAVVFISGHTVPCFGMHLICACKYLV